MKKLMLMACLMGLGSTLAIQAGGGETPKQRRNRIKTQEERIELAREEQDRTEHTQHKIRKKRKKQERREQDRRQEERQEAEAGY
jgi:hypothetical protein